MQSDVVMLAMFDTMFEMFKQCAMVEQNLHARRELEDKQTARGDWMGQTYQGYMTLA